MAFVFFFTVRTFTSCGFITANNAFYLYTGVQAEYEIGSLNITPSFAPGYYGAGSGKDLGYPLEFKTEVQVSFDFSELGMNENAILVKAVFSDEDGSFEYNLEKYAPINGIPEMFNMSKDYKKVKNLKMF